MAKYRPDIKPPMWGPPDAVQAAVRENSEKLGIDHRNIKYLAPFWEMAGSSYNLIDGAAASNHSGWAQTSGLDFNAQYYNSNAAISPPSPALSVLFIGNNTGAGGLSGDRGIIDTRNGTGDWDTERGFTLNVRDDNDGTNKKLGGLFFSVGTGFCRVNRPVKNIRSRRRVLCSWSGGEAPRLFIDGGEVLYDEQVATTSYAAGRSTFIVGAYYDYSSSRRFYGNMDFLSIIYEDLSAHAEMFHETPYALIMPVSRPVYFDLGAGGSSYTETLDTLITSISSVADRQAYRETVDTLITSGATVDAVTGMVEALLSLGVSASTAADVQGYADGVSDTIISASDTADAQDYVDGPDTTGVSTSDETDTQAYTDSLADTLISASNVTDTTGAPPLAESLLTTAVSASNVSAAQAYVDTVTALAVSASSLGEVLGLVESLGTVAESISAVSDRQLYFDNVAIVAISTHSLAEVGAYIEQVSAAAVSVSGVADVLVGSFIGRYVFVDYCRPRSFEDVARPRSFVDYCRPRGRTLQ